VVDNQKQKYSVNPINIGADSVIVNRTGAVMRGAACPPEGLLLRFTIWEQVLCRLVPIKESPEHGLHAIADNADA
jgi:hypothetical protein